MQSANQPQINRTQATVAVQTPTLRRGNFGLPVSILQRFLANS